MNKWRVAAKNAARLVKIAGVGESNGGAAPDTRDNAEEARLAILVPV